MPKIKKSIILSSISIIIIISIFFGYLIIQKKEKTIITNAIEAIPINAAIIIEINKTQNIIEKINTDTNLINKILNIKQLTKLNTQLKNIDTIIKNSEILKKILKKEKIVISAHQIGPKELQFLTAFKIPSKKIQKKLLNEIKNITKKSNKTYKKYNQLNIITFNTKNTKFYYTIVQNIFIISKSELLIENAIRQKQSNNPIYINIGFKKTAKTLSKNKTHIFINFNNFANISAKLFKKKLKKTKFLKSFASHAAFDINYYKNLISLSGYTYTKNTPDMFLNIFNQNKPENKINFNIIPYKSAEIISYQVSNFSKFYAAYEKYISSKNISGEYTENIKNFNKKHKINIHAKILKNIDNSINFINTNFNNTTNNYKKFIAIKIKNKNNWENILKKITLKYTSENNIEKNFSKIYKIDNKNNIKMFQLPVKNFLNLIFNELANFKELNYYFFLDQYIIFGKSYKDLEKYYFNIYTENSINKNENFKKFIENIPEKANITYLSNNMFNSANQMSILSPNFNKIYSENISKLNKIQFSSIQFNYEKENLYQTHLNTYYNKNIENTGLSAWEIKLKTNLKYKPILFLNHYSFDKEILIADDSNYIYLINKEGKTLWVKHLTEDIVGNFNIVDLYKNNKYQIMLTTKNNIITIDRNGKLIKEKSIKLKNPTNKGISIIDYENKKNYRIFVAQNNNKIYLYDKNLKPIDDWIKPQTKTKIVSKIYHFKYLEKDYIVFGEKIQAHILNRKGEKRITIKNPFPLPNECFFFFQTKTEKNKPGFITSDPSGKIVQIDLQGNVTFKKFITLSADHKFTAYDIDNDKNLDYIFSDNKTIFVINNNGKTMFSHTFSDKIIDKPVVLKFSEENIQIGVTIENQNKTYIFLPSGNIRNNFPINGNSTFSVGKISSKKHFNLIVAKNNFLYNYILY